MTRILFLTLSLALSPAWALEALIPMTDEQAQHVGIRTLTPQTTHNVPLLRAPARVSLPPNNEYVISAAQAGLISKVDVALGSAVAKGQVLAQIDSPDLVALQRNLLDAATAYQLAQSRLNRDQTLHSEGLISTVRWQETRSDYERQATALSEAEQVLAVAGMSDADIRQLKRTRRLSSRLQVRAPMNGVILERLAVAGQRVDLLAPLFRIGRLDELWLEIDMPQERLAEIRVGDEVGIEATDLSARIVQIGQAINPGTQSTLVRAVIDGKTGAVKPGQHVNVQLTHASTDLLFRLPIAALISQDGKDYVFVRVPGGFAPKPVAVASREEREVVIHGGLADGDVVVVQGVAALKAAWVGIGGDE